MKSRDFCYWLQGVFEVGNVTQLDEKQTQMVKNHLNLVFKHEIDPEMGDEKAQEELNAIHNMSFPTTEEEAILKWGPKPSPDHKFSLHGWYHPKEEGLMRC